MSRNLLLIFIVFCGIQPIFAQKTVGKGDLEINTQGQSQLTTWSSQQVYARYEANLQQLTMESKLSSFEIGNPSQQEIIKEVLFSNNYPILQCAVSLENWDMKDGTSASLPVRVHLGGKEFMVTSTFTANHSGQQILLSGEWDIDLSKQGLAIPAAYSDKLNQVLTFSIDNFALVLR